MTANYNSVTVSIEGNTGYPDGYKVGTAATDLVGFYGATPVAQPATIADATAVTTAAAIAVSGGFGFSTSAQVNAIVTSLNTTISNLNTLISELETLGLIASA